MTRLDGASGTRTVVDIRPGMTVCFTGEAVDEDGEPLDRSALELAAKRAGLVPVATVTKSGCGLLVAADTESPSGKTKTARQHGVPIASATGFLSSLQAGTVEAISVASPGVALVCSRCGDSWMAKRRSATPVCDNCKGT